MSTSSSKDPPPIKKEYSISIRGTEVLRYTLPDWVLGIRESIPDFFPDFNDALEDLSIGRDERTLLATSFIISETLTFARRALDWGGHRVQYTGLSVTALSTEAAVQFRCSQSQ
jgi:hypothetical protein